MSLSLSCSGKLRILDKAVLASHNMLVEAIRTNPLMKITGDNLDMYIRTNHQRTDNSNQDIHWFASNAFFTRLNYQNLPENTPEVRLKDIAAEMFVLTGGETMKLNDVKKVLIGRLLCDRDDFQWLKNKLPQHIPHRYSDSMSKKQHVYTLKIMFKNESKNEDCLDIMGEYEDQIIDLHTKAYGNTDNLDKYGVVLGGDMLTRERLQNAKNITYLAPTPRGRFEHLAPVTCELWHVKQDLLSKAYKALFKSDSLGECGTLFHMKTALRRNDVNGNVKSNYKAHEELFLLIVKALIHVASDEIRDCREQNRDIVLSNVFSKIYGLGYSTDDYIYNYFTNLITWGMQIMNMNDTAKEGDMERLIMNMKENAAFFYSHSVMSKYFSECINTILQVQHLSSPHMKMRQLEGAFINTKGGSGKNKEADLVQEHAIRNQKDLIRGLGANKTENGSRRASSSADIIHRIGDNVDHLLGIPKFTSSHAKKTSSKDLEIAINILSKVQPFKYVKGRKFESFKTIQKNPKLIVQRKDLIHAIHKKIQRLFLNS
ncbi:uncharacterized protein LOC143052416 [Mytilus galloprovincialis]|uniref:uncharacterized protein LOC143052416 n=1 Tax=Mytilus galloprovincialis TaxID=29158 RepID=UPI003F7C6F8D